MSPNLYTPIKNLKLTASDDESCRKCPTIKVRVTRLCPAFNNPTKKHLLSFVSMVLIDQEGDHIYAEIAPQFWSDFRSEVIDDEIHIFTRFRVVPNKNKFRVVSESTTMVEFIYDTYVRVQKEEDSIIPKHKFDFLNFSNINNRRDDDTILTDLLGVFITDHSKGNYFAIEIEEESGQRVRVALWDACVSDFKTQQDKHRSDEGPLIVALSSLRVKTYNGYTSLTTSSSSRVYINLHIPDVNELMERVSGKILAPPEPTKDVPTKDISSILDHCKAEYRHDMICYCVAQVKEIVSERSWKYSSCTTCSTKPELNGAIFFCEKCQKIVEAQTIRYCIDLKVQDKDCTAIFVVFDDDAKKYIGQDAVTLYDECKDNKEKGEYSTRVPKRIHTTFVGKEFLFKIKIKAVNHDVSKKTRFSIIDISEKNVKEDVCTLKRTTFAQCLQPPVTEVDHVVADSLPLRPSLNVSSVVDLVDLDDDQLPISPLPKKAKRDTGLTKAKRNSRVKLQSQVAQNPTRSSMIDISDSSHPISAQNQFQLVNEVDTVVTPSLHQEPSCTDADQIPKRQPSKRAKRVTGIRNTRRNSRVKFQSQMAANPTRLDKIDSLDIDDATSSHPTSEVDTVAAPSLHPNLSCQEAETDAAQIPISQPSKRAKRDTVIRKSRRVTLQRQKATTPTQLDMINTLDIDVATSSHPTSEDDTMAAPSLHPEPSYEETDTDDDHIPISQLSKKAKKHTRS